MIFLDLALIFFLLLTVLNYRAHRSVLYPPFIFCGVTAARSFRAQVLVYFAAMLAGIAGSALLVPRFGLIGAGEGLLLSTLILVLGGGWALRRVVRAELR